MQTTWILIRHHLRHLPKTRDLWDQLAMNHLKIGKFRTKGVHLSATGKWNILGKLLPHVLTKWGNLSLKQLLKSNELSWLFLEQIILFWKLQRNRYETIDVLNDHWLAIKVPPDSVDFDLLETRRYFSVGPKIQNKKEICKTCFFENGKKK